MRKIILTGLVLLFTLHIHAIERVSDAQAMFIYNFSRLVEWPAAEKSGEFVIGIFGDSELITSLERFMQNKTINGKPVQIKRFKSEDEITKCQILFVTYGKSSKIDAVKSAVGNSACLIIGEKPGLTQQGAAISFVILQDKLKFELNPDNAKQHNLIVSNSLKEMAI